MAQIHMDMNTNHAAAAMRTQSVKTQAPQQGQSEALSTQAAGAGAAPVRQDAARVQTTQRVNAGTDRAGKVQQAAQTGRIQQLPYGRGNAVTDNSREGISLQTGPNIRYENEQLGRVIEQRKPWTQENETAAGQAIAAQARAESDQRSQEVEARREATAETMARRREQIEEVREQAIENREEQAVARVQHAAASVDGPMAQAAVNAVTEQAERAPTTYSGISETDLERMVQTGEISQDDYNREMEAREEQQQGRAEQNQALSRDTAKIAAGQERNDRSRAEIKGLGEGNDRISAASRSQALEAADTTGRQAQASNAKAANMTVNIS